MDRTFKWFVAILLPLLASCSYGVGIVKKTPDLKSASQQKIDIAEKGPSSRSSQLQEGAFHIVAAGESLRHICDVYGLDFAKVVKINKILPPYSMKEGDEVFLPAQALLDESEQAAHWQRARLQVRQARSLIAKLFPPPSWKTRSGGMELNFPCRAASSLPRSVTGGVAFTKGWTSQRRLAGPSWHARTAALFLRGVERGFGVTATRCSLTTVAEFTLTMRI